MYKHDLPSLECVQLELSRWKQRYVLRGFVAFTAFTDTLRFKFLTHQFSLDCFLTCILKGNLYLHGYQRMEAAATPVTPEAAIQE